jgi:predicted nucleic acid-binding protein
MVMLDTNICVYILKKHPLYLLEKFNQIEEINISAIVYAELCSGVTLSPEHLQTARQIQLQNLSPSPHYIAGMKKRRLFMPTSERI